MVTEEQESSTALASEMIPVPHVQTADERPVEEVSNQPGDISRRRPRTRKNALNAAILKQMEFYFSDANLSKDRFLGNLIKQDPKIDLGIFLRFNKIRALTTELSRVAKALKGSTILSVSEDGTKVWRVTPIKEKENLDECTIYVQGLSPGADHELLSTIFSQYGTVEYISVPRYKSNKKIKGFAFVEFQTPESSMKCIKAFQEKGCVLPSQTSPDELLSITTFDESNQVEEMEMVEDSNERKTSDLKEPNINNDNLQENSNIKTTDHNNEIQSMDTEQLPTEVEGHRNKKKNKHKESKYSKDKNILDEESNSKENNEHKNQQCTSSDTETSKVEMIEVCTKTEVHNIKEECGEISSENDDKQKRRQKNFLREKKSRRFELPECIGEDRCSSKSSTGSKKKIKNNENIEESKVVEEEPNIENNELNNIAKDPEDSKKMQKRKRKRHSKSDDMIDGTEIGMQVMAKKDWKRLRNKYLELQRNKMKLLKQHLKRARWNQWNSHDKLKTEKEEAEETNNQKEQNTAPSITFVPGVIVKIEMEEPCSDPKSFKAELRNSGNIKYIDVPEGATAAFIRCDSAESALALAQKSAKARSATILQGEEETNYWDKILKDRAEKLGKKIRPKQRGREKVLKKAEKELGKHIKFDEV
ncbi:la-related protein 7 [Orussus abietinus]|uniref:la-related protein 7 n=1 Tax=Orussus abietinus TaxID=222816 RepID=UPI000625FD75|nr:la-related protein 7 [Orussus abietinus]